MAPRGPGDRAGSPQSRLLEIAAEHVRRFGPRRVTVVGVADEAGMTHANVYRYFASREALLDAVVGLALRPVETQLADIASAPDPADDKLERMILVLAHGYRDLLEREAAIFDMLVDAVESDRSVARRHLGRVRSLVARALDEGIATGAFEPRNRDAAFSLLTDALHRFTHPVAIKLDVHRVRSTLDQRLMTTLRVVRRALAGGLV